MPLVSVLLPVRNGAATLGQAVASVVAQTLSDLEIVLVDDGSDDGSAAVAREVAGRNGRLRILSPGRVGLVESLRVGLEACRAPLVARMDADDVAEPDRLERQVDHLHHAPEVAVVGCLVQSFAEAGVREGYRQYEAWQNRLVDHEQIVREIWVESPLAHPSVLFRREAIVALGGYRDMGWPEDYDLWLRAARAGLRFAKVPLVLLRWRDHAQRLSRIDPRYSLESFLRCKAHHLVRGPLAGRGPVVIWGAGMIGRRLGKHLVRAGAEIACFVDIDPRKIGGLKRGAPVIAPDALPRHRGRFLLAAVGSRGARDQIREQARAMGWVEGEDLLCVA